MQSTSFNIWYSHEKSYSNEGPEPQPEVPFRKIMLMIIFENLILSILTRDQNRTQKIGERNAYLGTAGSMK